MRRDRLAALAQLALVALALLLLAPVDAWTRRRLDPSGVLRVAFWQFLAVVVSAIWKGLRASGKYTLKELGWGLSHLWDVVKGVSRHVHDFGAGVWKRFKSAGGWFKHLYHDLLPSAWRKFWKQVDSLQRWLQKHVGPLVKGLVALRDDLLQWWAKYVRPWLDLLDITRRVLRVLGSFGLDWARRLDRRLADLEEKIEQPFLWVIGKLNEVISIVNRVATADGLFQRLAFIRTLERDYKLAWAAMANAYHKPRKEEDWKELRKRAAERTPEAIRRDLEAALQYGGGRYRAAREEAIVTARRALEGR